ncbi:MAG: lipoyl(octanoyl) transferase LipB [Chloroflexi bacterium]|nr:lipoyl(octanoyl) transferase LipB [Chloroflexota bacterium]
MNWAYLGLIPFRDALELQKRLVALRKAGRIDDTLLLLQHPPVITLGVRGRDEHVLAPRAWLAQQGVEVVRTERGGDVTYHGPGQLVGYPIIDLAGYRKDVGWYVSTIASVIVDVLAEIGVSGVYEPSTPGVWVGNDKVAAIGARIEGWVTYHGFGLNVAPDMAHWQWIVPCGIPDRGVTSIAQLSGRAVNVNDMLEPVVRGFGRAFGVAMRELSPGELEAKEYLASSLRSDIILRAGE